MRIDPTAIVTITDLRERKAPATDRPASSPSTVVSLGEAAGAARTSAPEGGITTRIASIRSALHAGTYVVDLDKLSERILDDDLDREGTP